jgi:peptidoglycan/xylan/chitin deacetylase (PgdA/CDA1 family)
VGPHQVVNLTVHGIGTPPRALDPGEDRTWVTVEQFERMLDAVDTDAGRRNVRITFDDGNASDVEIGLPRLLERGLRAEFFVLAGLLGEPGRLDAAGVRELVEARMRVGSHGWAHRDWRRLSDTEVRQELLDAPRVIAELCDAPVRRVAVPFGSYDRRVLGRLRSAGVQRVFTSDGGPARRSAWLQPRTSIHAAMTPDWLTDVLSGSPSPKARARRALARTVKRWR